MFSRNIRDYLSQLHLKLTRRYRTGGGTERLMYTDPRNSWVREVAGGIPSLCSVLNWAGSVHCTACCCVTYCFINTTAWRRVGTGRMDPPMHILGRRWKWPLGRSIGHSGLQSGRHPLVEKLGRSRNLSAVRKHQHDCQWDWWNGAGGQTCICDEFRVGIQPLVVVLGHCPLLSRLSRNVAADECRKKLSEPRYKS